MYSSNHIPFAAHSKLKHCLGPTVLSEQRLSKVYRYKQKRQARSARVTTDSAAFRGRCFFFLSFCFLGEGVPNSGFRNVHTYTLFFLKKKDV